ncbi:hypothetical protein PACTADRAFT_50927 [Pachysolen tannophilus NRRL Y-2460]|uniref:Flavin prenyltransferase PAD1, mitochondrial n=1 Tax=Pachysolen tannophilus NRRL Y-2460 TaxID=669874 RepID=A0A1E4TQN7_PACTA|nr:hypothetical protein PACTADRAFT_50927 [Pachysolen tannophilus NRRL Y-2460]
MLLYAKNCNGLFAKGMPFFLLQKRMLSSLQESTRRKRIIVAMTGASGSIYGIRILETLKKMGIESHLIMSKWAVATIKYETDYRIEDIVAMADYFHGNQEMSATISSGSFVTDGMIIAPCSAKSLAAIRTGLCSDLISRAADVIIKENRKLVLMVRETPLSPIHLDNMTYLSRIGVTVFPPVPAFYVRPNSIDDLVEHTVGRVLDQFNLDTAKFERWKGSLKK